MKSDIKRLSIKELKAMYKTNLVDIMRMAAECEDLHAFKDSFKKYLSSDKIKNDSAGKSISELIKNDGKIVFELSTEKEITISTIQYLWLFLNDEINDESYVDLLIDLYYQLMGLYQVKSIVPSFTEIKAWMDKWPSGLNPDVMNIREANKQRIIHHLIEKIENPKMSYRNYRFEQDMTTTEKEQRINEWWNDFRFHLAMAIRNSYELNKFLDNSLSKETLEIYHKAEEKGIPIFITPYYLSLLNIQDNGFDDNAIRSYVLYSSELVETFGKIHAWEKEDKVENGKPNTAGWLLPEGNNIHRRYPEVAILIPDSMGRACGGLCASCQRMYDFQSKRLNFNFIDLLPKEGWEIKMGRLLEYFEKDTQIRDILITGGDALMSQNKTLRSLLDAVCDMAQRKRDENKKRKNGEKFAEIERIRLGTRLPVYLPMRVNDELIQILKDFKEKASKVGIKQFIIQTHFQSPLEVTKESNLAIKKLIEAGWTVTNQLVYNVAASRRGHTSKLREVLNKIGVLCYYTFSVKGFKENYAVFTPNNRSIQEQLEEKMIGRLTLGEEQEFMNGLKEYHVTEDYIQNYCKNKNIPFISSDRNVMNLPGIGKSMTFNTVGITKNGERILAFEHDSTRKHSPIIEHLDNVFIQENKSIYNYLLQLQEMGEDITDYESLWTYSEGHTESRFPYFNYPDTDYTITKKYSNLGLE